MTAHVIALVITAMSTSTLGMLMSSANCSNVITWYPEIAHVCPTKGGSEYVGCMCSLHCVSATADRPSGDQFNVFRCLFRCLVKSH